MQVDELGRGTAPKEGAAIVGAVLEELDRRGCPSLFATHLHEEIGHLPLMLNRTKNKVLRVVEGHERSCDGSKMNGDNASDNGGPVHYVYQVEDGVCDNSHSLATASYHGVDEELIKRARELRRDSSSFRQEDVLQKIEKRGEEEEQKEKQKEKQEEMLEWWTKPTSLDEYVSRMESLCGRESVLIPPEWDPPPTIADDVPCVYVVEIDGGGNGGVYIGETEHLADRMKRHRQVYGKNIRVVVFPINVEEGGRTEARRIEARGIVEARRAGFIVHNTAS